jgi:hypothetical protein
MIDGPYTYELTRDGHGHSFQVRDKNANRVAACCNEDNARDVAHALNALSIPIERLCGHTAGSACAECHRLLVLTANELAEVCDNLLAALREIGTENAKLAIREARRRLPAAAEHNRIEGTD